jgi:hypothetical protein
MQETSDVFFQSLLYDWVIMAVICKRMSWVLLYLVANVVEFWPQAEHHLKGFAPTYQPQL